VTADKQKKGKMKIVFSPIGEFNLFSEREFDKNLVA